MNLYETVSKLKEKSALNPARKQVLKVQLMQSVAAERMMAFRAEVVHTRASFFSRIVQLAPMVAVVLGVVLVSGGVSFAAQGALPGEALYAVKVNVNEKIAIAFAGSEEQKVEKEAEFASRRLAEAADLAAVGKLEGDTKTNVAVRLETQVAAVQKKIETLRNNGKKVAAIEIASQLESSLRGHKAILDRVMTNQGVAMAVGTSTESEIDHVVGVASTARAILEVDIALRSSSASVSKEAAYNRIEVAKKTIAAVHADIEKNRDNLDIESIASVELTLGIARDGVVKAEERAEQADYVTAFTRASEAIRIAKNARLELKAERREVRRENVQFERTESIEERLDILFKAGL